MLLIYLIIYTNIPLIRWVVFTVFLFCFAIYVCFLSMAWRRKRNRYFFIDQINKS